ncbi:MAG TPA: hypothetical protein VNS88_10910, partial [Nitrospiraceae bacterium]|nr:hypothetical protein [Nitrospiraceae bacterium]
TVDLGPGPSGQPRIDVVFATSTGTLGAAPGTPAANPKVPAISTTTSTPLAFVYRPAGSSTIAAAQIVSKRTVLPPLPALAGSVGLSGFTMNQSRLLGRINSGVGPIEEIALGTGLSFSGGVLNASGTGGGTAAVPYWFNVKDYGALCTGAGDDSAAIQSAINAALAIPGYGVLFPPGDCRITSTIVFGSTAPFATSFLYVKGSGAQASNILWGGANTGTAVRIARNKYAAFTDIGVVNQGTAGTSVGIEEGGNTVANDGTQTLAMTFTNTLTHGFATCIQAGGHNGAASEVVYINHTFENCAIGWNGFDLNTLDHTFIMPSGSSNGVMISAGAAQNFQVLGGSVSNSTITDFRIDQVGTFNINGIRSEGAAKFILGSSRANVHVSSVAVVSLSGSTNAISGTFDRLTIASSELAGTVIVDSKNTSMTNSKIRGVGTTRTSPPIVLTAAGEYTVTGNTFHDPSGTPADFMYEDQVGRFDEFSANNAQPYPYISYVRGPDQNGQSLTAPQMILHRVASIAEGTAARGRNLRQEVQFGSLGSVTVGFQHSVTVTLNGTALTVTSGRLYPSDLGKRAELLNIPSAGTSTVGYIGGYTDSTHGLMQPFSAGFGTQTGIQLVIGEAEPDANYFITLACDKAETIYWTGKASGGFNLNSSNASSTATCDVGIYR